MNLSFICNSQAQDSSLAILREWAVYAGNTDSAFQTPIVSDSNYTYVASVVSDSIHGVDIVIHKYMTSGDVVWMQRWSGTGFGRDQSSAICIDRENIYLCGTTYSSANNFDYVIIKLAISTGAIDWVRTYNGSASNYDVATAIAVTDSEVYVTGVSNNGASAVDYHTIKYDMSGNVKWQHNFDYNSLMDIPFGLSILEEDSGIVITGASQSSVYDWDYQTVIYNYHGTVLEHPRASGSAAGFDRALAVKADGEGNIYITGTTFENNSNFDIKTVKLDKTGTFLWVKTIDYGNDDIANDILVNDSGEVYLCGVSHIMSDDFFLIKIDGATGDFVWDAFIDGNGENDTARKMCFDSHGNIIVTGQSYNHDNGSQDFLTVGYQSDGTKLWQDYFDPSDHESDNATDITSDVNGNIFVTGSISNKYKTATIKYRTDYFTEPPQIDTPSVANLFYPNSGQLVDVNDSTVTDSVHYYTLHHYPQLYFGYGTMNMVWSRVDQDTSTTDTLQRVDVTFLNSSYRPPAFPIDEQTESGYLNYFLAQCPEGITNVYGNSSLLFGDIYTDINAVYSSNSAGLKLSFVCGTKSTPNEIGLAFAGQTGNVSIDQNWGLKVHTAIGDYVFEKPRVYQIDGSNNRVSLPWQLSWHIASSGEANFTGWGSYDEGLPLVVEVARVNSANSSSAFSSLTWSTYVGNAILDNFDDIAYCEDNSHYCVVGQTLNSQFPLTIGLSYYSSGFGSYDIVVTKFNIAGSTSPTKNIEWCTYYGGSGTDFSSGITVNNTGDVYITGYTESSDFIIQPSNNTGYFHQDYLNGNYVGGAPADAFLVRFNSAGTQVLWSTFFGGWADDAAYGIEHGDDDDIYIVGYSASDQLDSHLPQFPIHPSSLSASSYNQPDLSSITSGTESGFIARFDDTDNLKWSTFFGGDLCATRMVSLTKRMSGSVIDVVGTTDCASPSTLLTGSPYVYTSLGTFPYVIPGSSAFHQIYGGSGDDFIAEFSTSTDELIYSTYFGGNNVDNASGESSPTIKSANDNQFIFVGATASTTGFPLAGSTGMYYQNNYGGGNSDAFVSRFDSYDNVYTSYFGGDGEDVAYGLSVDQYGKFYFAGTTSSIHSACCNPAVPTIGLFPITNQAIYLNSIYSGGTTDAFIASIDPYNSLDWSTYIGGDDADCLYGLMTVPNPNAGLYAIGYTVSSCSSGTPYPQTQDSRCYWQNCSSSSSLPGWSDAVISRFKLTVPVGINELALQNNNFKIFPNPCNGNFNLLINGHFKDRISVYVIDILGKLIKKIDVPARLYQENNIIPIDISEKGSGIYAVEILTGDAVFVGKIIKQ